MMMRGVVAIVLFVLAIASASAFVTVDHWWLPDIAFANGFIDTAVDLDLEELPSNHDIKVVFSIPELNLRAGRGFYDPLTLRSENIQRTLLIPEDAEAGQYTIRMTVIDEDGNRHVRHRFVKVE
jgi:hypothetical protein